MIDPQKIVLAEISHQRLKMKMGNPTKTPSLLISLSTLLCFSAATDTISPTQFIADGQTLVSVGGAFALGFFSPQNSTNRYLGIWYNNIKAQTVVWVANRRRPIADSSGNLTVTAAGALVLTDRSSGVVWSTDGTAVDPVAQILGTGNLVVREKRDESKLVWQSFDFPSDTLLPGMKLGWDLDLISTSGNSDTKVTIILVTTVSLVLGALLIACRVCYKWRKKIMRIRKGVCSINGQWQDENIKTEEDLDLPLFALGTGKLGEGQEIAVKRLSKSSIQGIDRLFSWPKFLQFLKASPPNNQSPNQLQFSNNTPFWNASATAQFMTRTFDQKSNCSKSNSGGARDSSSISSMAKKSNGSEPASKKLRIETPSPLPTFKVRKEKLGDRITALQQLVSPFGKTDTASVLHEAIEYIKFLHDQVNVLSTPYFKIRGEMDTRLGFPMQNQEQSRDDEGSKQDLRSRGLCLVPVSSTYPVWNPTFWNPTF